MTIFKGTSNFYEPSTTEVLDINLKFWLDWSFLSIGAFNNVTNSSGVYNGNLSRMFPVKDKSYSNGQLWKAPHGNWVWESGLEYDTQPINISGIYIDGALTTTGYSVDYPNGQIILDSAINTNSEVTVNYSHKIIDIKSASVSDWFNDIQTNSLRVDFAGYGIGSGEYQYDRVQTPAIIYEAIDKDYSFYQMGLGQYSQQGLLFHIITQDRATANKLSDIISEQNEKTIFLFDAQLLSSSGVYPLNYKGDINNGALTYSQLIQPKEDDGYRWRKLRLYDSHKQKTNKLNNELFHTPVRFKTDLVLTDI